MKLLTFTAAILLSIPLLISPTVSGSVRFFSLERKEENVVVRLESGLSQRRLDDHTDEISNSTVVRNSLVFRHL
jgi:hypothetical protein